MNENVKTPSGGILEKTIIPEGKQVVKDKEFSEGVKERYKGNVNEDKKGVEQCQ